MVSTTIDNTAIDIQVANGESTTVPSGEVWKVTVIHAGDGTQTAINGEVVITGLSTPGALETVFIGGDTIEVLSGSAVHIGGFVV